jgi:transposase
MPKTRPAYPEQFRREALELVCQGRSIPDVAGSLGVSPQSLRNWQRQGQRDRGERDDGLASAEREELRELPKRVKRLTQERDILKHAGRPRPGDCLPAHLGQEDHWASRLLDVRAAGRLGVWLLGVGEPGAVRSRAVRRVADGAHPTGPCGQRRSLRQPARARDAGA